MEKQFREAYAQLNDSQKQAVDTTDGPVLVIAGPGSGKTQLLALRAAQILRKDSTMLPSNILCLTFTDSAAHNMRLRLARYIGQDAYRVAIHTFNSFGAYVMNAYPEYFYQWRETQTADELTTYKILEEILTELPGDHPLAARSIDGSFFAQNQIKNLIGDAKRADLQPADFSQVLKENQQSFTQLLPIFREHWPPLVSGRDALAKINECIEKLRSLKPAKSRLAAVMPVQQIILNSLEAAQQESAELPPRGRTKPFTAWKNEWLEKDEQNALIFSAGKHYEKLVAAAEVYQKYQQILEQRGLADFNDQIMRVLAAMRAHNALRYNLQERFQYIMVDEFQDTNRSQLLMTRYLTDAPVHEGRPNILAVGDDDQAIFRFQGADIGNVGLFEAQYREPTEITLTVNYRSNPQILDSARDIAKQIGFSLEKQKHLDKSLKSTVKTAGKGVVLNEFAYDSQHYSFVAEQIKQLLAESTPGKEIAVLARERSQLDSLVPYLRSLKIPINYERRENILEKEHVINLLAMARLAYLIEKQQFEEANALLAQVLSHPMWGIKPKDIWQVATEAYRQGQFWLDVLTAKKGGRAKEVAEFFVALGFESASMPLEQVIDQLIGVLPAGIQDEQDDEAPSKEQEFFSPFKQYYFNDELLAGHPGQYLTLLSHLSTLREHLRNYQADAGRTLYLKDLIDFIDAYNRAGNLTMLDRAPHNEDQHAVQLMTIHKAKGLEFDNVFVIGLQNDVWTRTGGRGRFSYPANLKTIRPSDNQDDDGLRLLYVAMTRARHSLYLNYFLAAGFLLAGKCSKFWLKK